MSFFVCLDSPTGSDMYTACELHRDVKQTERFKLQIMKYAMLTMFMPNPKIVEGNNLEIPFLAAITNTTRSLAECIERISVLSLQTVKQNKSDCAALMENIHNLLNAIIIVYAKSDTGADLPPIVLNHIGRFTEYLNLTLYKIHTFVEAQRDGSKIKKIFRRGEMSTLLTDCNAGLQHAVNFFQICPVNPMTDIAEMQENAQRGHQEALNMVEALSDGTSSDRASSISRVYSSLHNSSNSITMLPSEPKIFHGRESELSHTLKLFSQMTARIAILGQEHRFFVACDSAATKVELAALIGAHLGLKPGKDLARPVFQHFSSCPPSLLILDNLETSWEPAESRGEIEEFLSLLTDVGHLALMITMRGAERPAKVAWTRPFLPPLKSLELGPARQAFIDIADDQHDPEEVDRVLSLTDRMPLAISLLAHLVASEGCSAVLSRWEEDKTSIVSEGFDKRSNLDLSISLSFSSHRIESLPDSRNLLSLLSMLPDGLSDAELVQSNLPIGDILGCKAALIRTSLAYTDEKKRLKALVPIREYVQKIQPPGYHLVGPLFKHFHQLLEFYVDTHGTQAASSIVTRISSNFANIQNVLQNGLQQDHLDLKNIIYSICNLNSFSRRIGQGSLPLVDQIHNVHPQFRDHQLEAYVIAELFHSQQFSPSSNPETLIVHFLKQSEQVADTDLKCRFYISIAAYYQVRKQDSASAVKFSKTAISLANSTGNTKRHAQGLHNLARFSWMLGDYSAAQMYARESQRLAKISGDFYREAQALTVEAMCLFTLGDYKKSISHNNQARDLLGLCGASGGQLDRDIRNEQAEVHRLKSEYLEARDIQSGLLHSSPKDRDPYHHAFALLNMAEIDISIGMPKQTVRRNIQMAQKLFHARGLPMQMIISGFERREYNGSKDCVRKKYKIMCGTQHRSHIPLSGATGQCQFLEHPHHVSSWTTVYLVHSLKFKEKLGIYKGLQFLGDIFLASDDEDTAISLFTTALEGFTQMDVHRSRAECMLRLGDISKGHGDLLKAVELWQTARPLFERSQASVGEDVLEHHKQNLARLAELNVPSTIVKELEDNLSDTEDLEENLDEAKGIQLVAA
ncbi:hypothetical protein B0H13DRAFT_1917525 [Mycena leptocephala]|nr:hypothetical protein B0H13DRAFT_1917525 [Mycena leptocephala]